MDSAISGRLRGCAQARWDVPALALGTSVADDVRVARRRLRAPTRASASPRSRSRSRRALALELLDLDDPTGVWPDDVRIRHLLSHTSGFDCELAAAT